MLLRIIVLILAYSLVVLSLQAAYIGQFGYIVRHQYLWYFLSSLGVGGLAFWRWVSQASFYATLKHELCHWFFGLLSLHKPHALQVNAHQGGSYQSREGRRNYFFMLSPYFFPITSYSLLLLSALFEGPTAAYYVLVGLALAFDTVTMYKDYHLAQTDWQVYGTPFSVLFSVAMYILFLLSLLVLLLGTSYTDYCLDMWRLLGRWLAYLPLG
ncbi:MAG: hypothetical protein SOW66_01445 [Porphyromonas sp.]|nr:hypothetical protein [Porphyromonas sp.]